MILFFLLTSVFFYTCTSILVYTIINNIGPVPSSTQAIKTLKKVLPHNPVGIIYELGCGWGAIACFLAYQYPEKQVIAVENSPIPWVFSKLRGKLLGLKNLQVRFDDLYNVQLTNAGLVYCYLHTKAMTKLKAKFTKEITKHCIIISHTFSIPGWPPEKIYTLSDFFHSELLVYQKKPLPRGS